MNKISIKETDIPQLLELFDKVVIVLSNNYANHLVNILDDNRELFNQYDDETSDIDDLFDEDSVLMITKYNDSYFVEVAFTDNGDLKLIEDMDMCYIENGLVNDIQIRKSIKGRVVLMDVYDNDDIIPLENEYFGNYEERNEIADELDGIFEDIVADMIDELEEIKEDDFCMHCVIKEALQRGYSQGYKNGLKMMQDVLNDILDEM